MTFNITPSNFQPSVQRLRKPHHSARCQRWIAALLGLSLLASALSGCGAKSGDPIGSTDTGNPPAIDDTRLRLSPSDNGVIVSGDPGAVPGGAKIEVTNLATGEAQTTTAAEDGSFELEIAGTVNDEYRVQVEVGGKSSSVNLNSSAVSLDGLTFLLDSAEGYTLVEGTTIRLSFQDAELNFNAGCNHHFGSYSLCDDKLCATNFGSTDMGCDQELHEQDQWVAAFLASTPSLTHTGDQLTLEGAEATLHFLDREVADPDRPLTGRVWTIDTFISGDAASNVPLQGVPTVEFSDDGSFSVFTSCNGGSGSYTVNGQELALTEVSYTEVACSNAFAEQHIQQVLTAGTVTYEIDAARLTLTRGNLGLGATTE